MDTLDPPSSYPAARAFLGLGSNLDPVENVQAALGLLTGTPGVRIKGISTLYWTPPLQAPGADPETVAGDPEFLNGVIEIRSAPSPEELNGILTTIEDALGRVRTENKYAPRTLDLDLLVYLGGAVREDGTDDPGRLFPPPHPDVYSRPWVALPLLELAPELVLSPDGTTLKEVARRFQDPGGREAPDLTRELRRRFLAATNGA